MKAKFEDLIKSNLPVLVDFSAQWCAPCRMMPPILKEIKAHFGDKIRIITIDVDKNPKIAAKYQIQAVPTLILFRNGEVLWRQAGVVPARELIPLLKYYIQ
jgi:thioredoxin 1